MKINPTRVAMFGLLLAGCATVFPSVKEIEEAQLVREEVDLETLHSGRILMVTNCQECHRLIPPTAHTPEECGPISERMGSLSGLDPTESAAVGSYMEHAARWNQMSR